MKIEEIPIQNNCRESVRAELVRCLRDMNIGQSVRVEKVDSNIRTLVWVLNQALDRHYGIRKQDDGTWRIGRRALSFDRTSNRP